MSTNLPNTAYVKKIDYWLIFSLLKPFVDILVQTYIHTLTEKYQAEWSIGEVRDLNQSEHSITIDLDQ